MKQFLASAIVNGNEVRLVTRDGSYFIHWGVPGDSGQAVQELLTPKGRPRSEGGAIKEFLKAAKAAQYLKFDKL